MWGSVRFQGSSQIYLGCLCLGAANPVASSVPCAFCASVIFRALAKPIRSENSPPLAGIRYLFSKPLRHGGLEIPQLQLDGDISPRIRYLGSHCSIGQPESP